MNTRVDSSTVERPVPPDDAGSIPVSTLQIVPIELRELNVLVARMHRHHKPVQGHRFSIGVECNGQLVGGCSVGRPVARLTDQRNTLEVTRLVTDGTTNACSILYAAAARAGKALGYEKIQTFVLESEFGSSLRAAGWKFDGETRSKDRHRPSTKLAKSWLFDEYYRTDQPMGTKHRYIRILNPRLAPPDGNLRSPSDIPRNDPPAGRNGSPTVTPNKRWDR
jgi:hypothetical protein